MNQNKKKCSPLLLLLLIIVIVLAAIVSAMSIKASIVKPETPETPEISEQENEAEPEVETPEEPAADAKLMCNTVHDEIVPAEIKDVLISFLNTYFETQMNIPKEYKFLSEIRENLPDMTTYFGEEYQDQATVWQNALVYITSAKAINPNDMNWNTVNYTLQFNNADVGETSCHLDFYETSEVEFALLGGEKSTQAEVECSADLVLENGQWKLADYYREEDFFLAIDREYENGATAGSLAYICDETIKLYHDNLAAWINDRTSFNRGTYSPEMPTFDVAYDREAADEYIQTYTLVRNRESWSAYDHIGGNCQNFASQVLYTGGIPMDLDGAIWKFYSDEPDNNSSYTGRSPAWTSAPEFNEYARENTGFGLVAMVDANVFSLSCGDLFQVGGKDGTIAHTNVVSGCIMHGDEIQDILLNSNSNTRTNWPLTATYSASYCGIVICGYNNY